MTETLLTPSSIKLFGRWLKSLTFTNDTSPFAGNYFLQRQLAVNVVAPFIGNTTKYQPSATVTADQVGRSPLILTADNYDDATKITGIEGDIAKLVPGMLIRDRPKVEPDDRVDDPPAIDKDTVITNVVIGKETYIKISKPALTTITPAILLATLKPIFARIYGFSFEGVYYPLPRPSIFLVHGIGQPVGNWGTPSTVDQSGVAAREWDFSGNTVPSDLTFWEYEKGDFSLRVDLEAGPFEQILLQMALRSGADRADRSGQGLDVRSGQGLDMRSGQGLRNGR